MGDTDLPLFTPDVIDEALVEICGFLLQLQRDSEHRWLSSARPTFSKTLEQLGLAAIRQSQIVINDHNRRQENA